MREAGRKNCFAAIRESLNASIVEYHSAQELNCYICYGTIGSLELSSGGERAHTIRQNVVGDDGNIVCYYDKMHLCDYGDCAETRFFVPGEE